MHISDDLNILILKEEDGYSKALAGTYRAYRKAPIKCHDCAFALETVACEEAPCTIHEREDKDGADILFLSLDDFNKRWSV